MLRPRSSEIVRAMGALVLLAALVVGVPAFLVVGVGWPLPTTWPSWQEVTSSFDNGAVPDEAFIKGMAVVAWLAWAQLTVTVAIEVVAVARGRLARRVRVVPSGLQALVARLVATSALLFGSLTSAVPAAPLGVPAVAVAAHVEVGQGSGLLVGDAGTQPRGEQVAEPATVVHTVERRDTLRGLADRYLGDADRWSTIFELNEGLSQPDGGMLVDPGRLLPGWQLLVPVARDGASGATVAAADEWMVETGDHFWGIAEAVLVEAWGRQPTEREIADYWVDLRGANEANLLPPFDDDVIYPGQVLALVPAPPDPAVPAAVGPTLDAAEQDAGDPVAEDAGPTDPVAEEDAGPTEPVAGDDDAGRTEGRSPGPLLAEHDLVAPGEAEGGAAPAQGAAAAEAERRTAAAPLLRAPSPPEPMGPPASQPTPPVLAATPTAPPVDASAGDAENVASESAADDRSLAPVVATVTGIGLLGAGFVWTIRRLRRSQRQRRAPGRLPTRPDPGAQRVEAALAADADTEGAVALEAAVRSLHPILDPSAPPRVVGVTLDADSVIVLLGDPAPAPRGWEALDEGYSWRLDRHGDLTEVRALGTGSPSPLPALVTVGHTDRGQVLVDLEHVGHAVVDAPDPKPFLRTVAAELALSHLADDLHVICVGFGHDLAHLQRIEVLDRIEPVLDDLETDATHTDALLADVPSALGGRLSSAADSWTPVVVLDGVTTDAEVLDRLAALAGRGISVVATAGDATWTFSVDGPKVHVEPIDVTLERRDLDDREAAALGEVVRAAQDLTGVEIEPEDLDLPLRPIAPEGIEVRVLGAVEVDGTVEAFSSRRAIDLVCFLAFQRDGADADQLKARLWHPDRPPTESVFANTVSRARKALGTDADGHHHLPRVGIDGVYRLGPAVITDVDRFQAHVAVADEADDEAAAARALRAALELVRGIPFTGGGEGAFRWADDGARSQIEFLVDETAHRLADAALARQDPDEARWAANQGLRLVPECEACYRRRMLAADLAGNRAELRQTMAELQRKVEVDAERPEASDLISADLVELYERLLERHEAPAG